MKKTNPPQLGFCKLCQSSNVEMHKDSHIFPAFMVRNIKPDQKTPYNDPLYVGTTRDSNLTKLKAYNYSGEFEKYIFCRGCEKKLSVLDDWAAKFFTFKTKGVIAVPWKKGFRESFLKFEGLDYVKYKLFILSLFVRTSLSDRPDLNFKLSKEDEEKICLMIVNNNPARDIDFPISKFLLGKPPGINRDRLFYPLSVTENIHMFFFSDRNNQGIVYALDTGNIFANKEEVLNSDGTFNALIVDDFATSSFYLSFLKTDLEEFFSDHPNINFIGIGLKPIGDELQKMMKSEGTLFDKLFIGRKK